MTLSWIQDFISTHLFFRFTRIFPPSPCGNESQLKPNTTNTSFCSQSLLSAGFFPCAATVLHYQEGSSHSHSLFYTCSSYTRASPSFSSSRFLVSSWVTTVPTHFPCILFFPTPNNASLGCQVNLPKVQVQSHHSLALKPSIAPRCLLNYVQLPNSQTH